MKVLLVKDEKGKYINKQQERCKLLCCQWVEGPRANDFLEFANLKKALEYFGLEKYPDGKEVVK